MAWTTAEYKEVGYILGYIILSFVSFRVLQFAVRWYLFGKCTFRTFDYFEFVRRRLRSKRRVPPSQSLQVVPPNKKWRISNEAVSFFHSVVSGLWALYACLIHPKLVDDMMNYVDPFPKYLIFFSFGYILHDLVDLLINERSARILELLFHHVVVVTAFMTTLLTDKFLGVVVLGLLMELNSVFLHSRSLMNLYGMAKTSTAFKMVALLNLATFVIFRMAVSLFLVYWQLTSGWSLVWYQAVVTFLVIFSLATTNSVLFYRVLAADGLLGKRRARSNTRGTGGAAEPAIKAEGAEEEQPIEEDEDEAAFDDDNSSDDLEGGTAARIRINSVSTAVQVGNGVVRHPAATTPRRHSVSIATQTPTEQIGNGTGGGPVARYLASAQEVEDENISAEGVPLNPPTTEINGNTYVAEPRRPSIIGGVLQAPPPAPTA